jgi:transposase
MQETNTPELRTEGKTLGADPGIVSVLTLSDGQASKPDNHGHTLSSILQKVHRKKKGSKARRRAEAHRENYINWSINQLNLEGVKQINLEENNTFNGANKGGFRNGWTSEAIKSKITNVAEELGVQVKLQPCTYKSQRCNQCGFVCKGNRKGKLFKCGDCGCSLDADLNGAINNEQELPALPKWVRQEKHNLKGFFWKQDGLWDRAGLGLQSNATVRNPEFLEPAKVADASQ